MVKATGHDNNYLNIHNHRPIIISLEKKCPPWQNDVSHMSKAEVTGNFAVENLLPEHNFESPLPVNKY